MKKSTAGAFSVMNMKRSIPLFSSCCQEMIEYIDAQTTTTSNLQVDCVELMKNLAVNTLGVVGFGMSVNSFKDTNCELRKQAEKLFDMKRFVAITMMPKLMAFLNVKVFSPQANKWFEILIEKAMHMRSNDTSARKDVLGALIKLNEENPTEVTKTVMVSTTMQFMLDDKQLSQQVAQ